MMLVAFMGYFVFAGAGQLLVSVNQLMADKDGAQQKTVQLTGKVVSATGDQSPVQVRAARLQLAANRHRGLHRLGPGCVSRGAQRDRHRQAQLDRGVSGQAGLASDQVPEQVLGVQGRNLERLIS